MPTNFDQSIVFTYTDRLAETSAFFRDVMKLDFVVDQGACHIYRLTGTSFLGVCDLPDRPRDQTGVTISMVSDDVDGWFNYLREQGVEFIREPAHSKPFGVYSCLFLSPHGYRIEIQRFDDSHWMAGRLQAPPQT